jgi:hypothetical protein
MKPWRVCLGAIALTACSVSVQPQTTAGLSNDQIADTSRFTNQPPASGTTTTGGSAGTSGGSGKSGSGGGTSGGTRASPGPTPSPAASGGSGQVQAGPNGSTLVAKAQIDEKKAGGKTYIPISTFGPKDDLYVRWTRGTFVVVAGSRPYTPNEANMIEVAMNQLNTAIGKSVFSFGGTTSGDIPVTTQDVAAGGVLGFAQFVPQVVSLEKAYVEAKVVMNVGNLQRFAPDPTNYQELFKTVMLHEMGHIAGLAHNPQDGTLMNAKTETTPTVVGFAQSEIDTLKLLYGN